jgi:hypothetical protein
MRPQPSPISFPSLVILPLRATVWILTASQYKPQNEIIPWHRQSSLFRPHIFIRALSSVPRSRCPFGLYCRIRIGGLSPAILSRQFIEFCLCPSVLFSIACILNSCLIFPSLIWSSPMQPLTVHKHLISTDLLPCTKIPRFISMLQSW